MKKTIAVLMLVLLLFTGCEKAPVETIPVLTEPVETTAAPTTLPPETTTPPETTVPPETTLPPETTEPPRVYVPQDPDPDTYPKEELQATAILYMGLLYVRDNREDGLTDTPPEECVWLGTTRTSETPGRPGFDLNACHIPEGTVVCGSPLDPDFMYYSTKEGWQRLIRAGLVENYWDNAVDPYQVPGDAMVMWFNALLNSYSQDNLYNHAVGSWFETAKDINVFNLFYNGIPTEQNKDLSKSEIAFLNNNGFGENKPAVSGTTKRLPVVAMDDLLTRFFGVRFEELSGVGLETMDAYRSETECYYLWGTSVYSNNIVATAAEVGEVPGVFTVDYYIDSYGEKTYGILTFQRNGDALQLLSNVPAKE